MTAPIFDAEQTLEISRIASCVVEEQPDRLSGFATAAEWIYNHRGKIAATTTAAVILTAGLVVQWRGIVGPVEPEHPPAATKALAEPAFGSAAPAEELPQQPPENTAWSAMVRDIHERLAELESAR